MTKNAACLALLCGICLAGENQSTFDFHSNFWVNLHHFLYEQAIAREPEQTDSPDWKAALDYYKREVVKHDLLSNDIAPINARLSELEGASSFEDSHIDPELRAVLNRAAPVYRARWWARHDRANRAWMDGAAPLVAKFEAVLKRELAGAYQTPWPATAIRTDVAEYASWSGAYTVIRPTHITISSTSPGNQGEAALELLFHEASHGVIHKISAALDAELTAQNKLFRRQAFWHAVLFYTAGEFSRRHLSPDYVPYALKHGLYDRAWEGALEVLDKDWKPYLDGGVDLAAAVKSLVNDYGILRTPAR